MFDELDQETWSYYGPLNILAYNVSVKSVDSEARVRVRSFLNFLFIVQVGYHNEHHDFPSVAWTKLPELHRIASDFYAPLPCHTSWPGVTFRFIFGKPDELLIRAHRPARCHTGADAFVS